MRRLKPELSPFEIHEAFELDRNSLLQGYEQEHAQTILEDLQSAGCQVRLHTVGETALVEPEVRSEQETLPFRTPTEEEFHEIRMGTDRHRVISLITSGELDLNATDPQGYPLLHGMQNARIASLLIEHGATVNAVDNEFNTPLHNCDDSATQEVLIENGVAINATNRTGDTALHRWAARGTLAPVKTLLHFNADPTVRNHEGNNAADMLATTGAACQAAPGAEIHAAAARVDELDLAQDDLGRVGVEEGVDAGEPVHLAHGGEREQ